MTAAVIDANVFVAAFSPERDAEAALETLRRVDVFHVPGVCDREVAHGLLSYVRRREIGLTDAERRYSLYLQWPKVRRHLDEEFDETLFTIAGRNTLGPNDLLYARLAARLDLPLVTADGGLVTNGASIATIHDLRTGAYAP